MEYVAALISFVVAIVSIRGDTWNTKLKGSRRLTTTGRITLAVAIAALVASIYSSWINAEEERRAREQREMVNRIAEMEACLAAMHLKIALDVMYGHATGQRTPDGADIGFDLADLKSPDAINRISKINLIQPVTARPLVGDTRSLDSFIADEAGDFIDLSNATIGKYSSYLDREMILYVSWLANHNLTRRMAVTNQQVIHARAAGLNTFPALTQVEVNEFVEVVSLLERVFQSADSGSNGMVCKRPEYFDASAAKHSLQARRP